MKNLSGKGRFLHRHPAENRKTDSGQTRGPEGEKSMLEHPENRRGSAEPIACGMRSPKDDRLSAGGIRAHLQPPAAELELEVRESVTSTSSLLREGAGAGERRARAMIAAAQTAGRGKPGRSFFSPPDTGIYLSVLLYPELTAGRAPLIGTEAAAAVCEAIEEVSGKKAWIKWVNDILIDGKKVCGILTEASVKESEQKPDYVIVGIGINVYPPEGGFPAEIRETAGSVFESVQPGAKNRLAAEVLNHLMRRFGALERGAPAEGYLGRSLAAGRRIAIRSGEGERAATVLDIDAGCRLLVRYDDGTEAALSAGEIRILP
jgi:BirA family biotin operon repressor/biotin-[acetyl-CoA-carboxylase] ligase